MKPTLILQTYNKNDELCNHNKQTGLFNNIIKFELGVDITCEDEFIIKVNSNSHNSNYYINLVPFDWDIGVNDIEYSKINNMIELIIMAKTERFSITY